MTIKSECVKLTAVILSIPIQIYHVESTLQIERNFEQLKYTLVKDNEYRLLKWI